ncbi:hypothetical protein BGX26_001249 [Mortierella sp. AD094]|nr:hypothetical protein BGX26_001249 [Mortierella sp. AD094]
MSESSSSPTSSSTTTSYSSSATTTTTTTTTSPTASITDTITNIITATATSLVSPTPTSDPITPTLDYGNDPYFNGNDLCDWTRVASNCRDPDFVKYMLISSSAAHLIAAVFGFWLLGYRNRGFNRKIVTDLYTKVGTGIRPKPMDCLVFYSVVASIAKIAGNLLVIVNTAQNAMWLRVLIEQCYWLAVSIGFSSYFVGLLYAMPVTTREGIFAVYQPEVVYGSKPLRPIHVLTPTTVQKNFLLIMGIVYPVIFATGPGVASGAMHDTGHFQAGHYLLVVQYANWSLILYTVALMFFYYGLKYTFILRANIIIAEAALKAPRAAFGIKNLKSRSPARFLFIQLQIMGFGGCAVATLAGTLCFLWVLFRKQILEMNDERWPHLVGVFWTCANALTFIVVECLVTAQSVRNRRRGLHDPSTTATGTLSQSGGQKTSGAKQSRSGSGGQTHPEQGYHVSDQETRLTQQSEGDMSTLDSEKVSLERYDENPRHITEAMYIDGMDRDRAAAASAFAAHSDRVDLEAGHTISKQSRDSWRPVSPTSPTSPSRPFTMQLNNGATPNAHSNIRESVFGGRTAREESTPTSPTGGGFSLPSFPLVALRSHSRNSITHPRPSVSSASHTTSTNSARFSLSSKTGTSSNGSYSLPIPTIPVMANASQASRHSLHRAAQRSYDPSKEDPGGDLLYNVPTATTATISPPPQSPRRIKSGGPSSPRAMQPAPIVTQSPTMSHQQQYYDDSRDNQDMYLQQQHPLHQVAFKGLSPPPRSAPLSPTTPTSATRRGMSTPTSPTVNAYPTSHPLASPSSPGMQGQQTARIGAGVRRSPSNANKGSRERDRSAAAAAAATAAAVNLVPSRGPGGGYQRGGEPNLKSQPQSMRQNRAQSVETSDDDDGASISSAGDERWPLPPSFN